jgi:hypothetical protein
MTDGSPDAGTGTGVAVSDTLIQINEREDFHDSNGNSRMTYQCSLISIDAVATDQYGRGTHSAGLIGARRQFFHPSGPRCCA